MLLSILLSVCLSVCLSVHLVRAHLERKGESSNLVKVFCHMRGHLIFGQKGQRSRSRGSVEVSNLRRLGGDCYVVVKATIRLWYDCDSIALREFDDQRYDCKLTWICAGALRPKYINRSAWLRLASYVIVTLMTFDKLSNGRRTNGHRIEVES